MTQPCLLRLHVISLVGRRVTFVMPLIIPRSQVACPPAACRMGAASVSLLLRPQNTHVLDGTKEMDHRIYSACMPSLWLCSCA